MVINQLAKLSTSLWLQLLLKPTMEPSTRNRASLTSRLPPRSNTITTPSLNWSHPYYQNRSTGPPRRSNSIHQNVRFALKTKHYISTNWTWRVRCRKLILIFRFFSFKFPIFRTKEELSCNQLMLLDNGILYLRKLSAGYKLLSFLVMKIREVVNQNECITLARCHTTQQ